MNNYPLGTKLTLTGQNFVCGTNAFNALDSECKNTLGPEWDATGLFSPGDTCNVVYGSNYPECVKARYLGDPKWCCMTGSDINNSLVTCDPIYNGNLSPKPTTCIAPMLTQCVADGKWNAADTYCMQYATENPTITEIRNAISKTCDGNLDDSFCRKWVMDHQGLYDDIVKSHCANGNIAGSDPMCRCVIVNAVDKGGFAFDPVCISSTGCLATGYKTAENIASMNSIGSCPRSVCTVSNTFNVGGDFKANVVVDQACGAGSIDTGTGSKIAAPTDNNQELKIIIFMLVLISLVIAVAIKLLIYYYPRVKNNL